jgi:hypothetical protein
MAWQLWMGSWVCFSCPIAIRTKIAKDNSEPHSMSTSATAHFHDTGKCGPTIWHNVFVVITRQTYYRLLNYRVLLVTRYIIGCTFISSGMWMCNFKTILSISVCKVKHKKSSRTHQGVRAISHLSCGHDCGKNEGPKCANGVGDEKLASCCCLSM